MTAERDGKSRRTGQPDLLASLPDERQVPGIDPAVIEKLLTEVQDLRNEFAGLKEAVSAEGPAPVTLEALEAWGDKHVARVAEAARTEAAPGDNAAATRIKRIEDAAAKAAAAAERIDGGLESTADRVTAEVGAAATRIEAGFRITRDHVDRKSRLVHRGCRRTPDTRGRAEVRLADGLRVLDRLRRGHVARELHILVLPMAVSPLSRRRSPSLPLPLTGAALSGA